MPRFPTGNRNPALWVSQNYLTSAQTIRRIVSLASLGPADHVIEIGPGRGHITRELLSRCGAVTAVELDAGLCESLRAKFAGAGNLSLCRGDFLAWPLPESGGYKVFANIPFSRTTEIVRKLTECANPPTDAWLVMERGAALRFMGRPRESLRSLMLRPWFTAEIAWRFRREDFHPMPGTDAVLLHLARKERPDIPGGQRGAYEAFVAAGMNGGARGLAGMLKGQLNTALMEAGVRRGAAPGDILYVQWLCLYRSWQSKHKPGMLH